MSSRWSDLERPPLSGRDLTVALVRPGGFWREVRVVQHTASTNADVATAALAGEPEGLVVIAETQAAGRGRLDRSWLAPPRAGLTFSVLLRPAPTVAPTRWSWLPLLAGVSLQRAVSRVAEVEARLKWPNDLLIGAHRRKAAGVLAQLVDHAVVLGIGLNVSTRAAELPGPEATSLAIEQAACTDRDPLLRGVLRQLAADYLAWCAGEGDVQRTGLHSRYLAACDTIGRRVQVTLPDDGRLEGVATTVDAGGQLVIRTSQGERSVSAGDVHHVRAVG